MTASRDKTAQGWNDAKGTVIAKLEGHTDEVYRAAFSAAGKRVVADSGD